MIFARLEAFFQKQAFTDGVWDEQRLLRSVLWRIGACLVFGILWAAGTELFGLKTAASPQGMESLTTAGGGEASRVIRDTWAESPREFRIPGAIGMLFLDLGFPLLYGPLLCLLCVWGRWLNDVRGRPLPRKVGSVLAITTLLAMSLDWMENILMLAFLTSVIALPGLWTALATVKIILLGAAVAYALLTVYSLDFTEGVLHTLNRIRFAAVPTLMIPLIFCAAQAQDTLRATAGAQDTLLKFLAFLLSTLFFAWMAGFCAHIVMRLTTLKSANTEPDFQRGAAWGQTHLPGILGAALMVGVAGTLYLAQQSYAPALLTPDDATTIVRSGHREILVSVALSLVILAVPLYGLHLRFGGGVQQDGPDPSADAENMDKVTLSRAVTGRWRSLPMATRRLFIACFLPGILFFALTWGTTGQWAQSIGSAATLLQGLGFFIPVGCGLMILQERLQVPLLGLLLGWVALLSFTDINDNHQVRQLPVPAEKRVVYKSLRGPTRIPGLENTFADWLRKRPDLARYVRLDPQTKLWEGSYPVFIVATEGGGIFAAYQTAWVLSGLQDASEGRIGEGKTAGRFSDHLFAISGVSGGSVGATVFAAIADRYGRERETLKKDDTWSRIADRTLAADLLSPALAMLLSPDLVQRYLPFPYDRWDRALGLEIALERAWTEATGGDEMGRRFFDLSANFATRDVPALFLNATRVDTGDRMALTTLQPESDLAFGTGQAVDFSDPNRGATFDGASGEESPGALVTLAQAHPEAEVRLSSAAFLSARFPVISASGYLSYCPPTTTSANPIAVRLKRRYVDGGYYENSGVTTLSDILLAMVLTPTDGIPWHPVIIRIGFSGIERRPLPDSQRGKAECEGPCRNGPGLDEVLAPLRAILGAWVARGRTEYHQLQRRVTEMENNGKRVDLIEFEFKQRPGKPPIPLGWHLSGAARTELQVQFGVPLLHGPGPTNPNGNPVKQQRILDHLNGTL